jgi:hypothetical protein
VKGKKSNTALPGPTCTAKKLRKCDLRPSLHAIHKAMSNKAALHAIGMEWVPPGRPDRQLAHSIDLPPARFQSSRQGSVGLETKIVSQIGMSGVPGL